MAYPPELIDQVRAAASIVEIIGRYVSLTQAGRSYKGLCPFHAEKTPSFIVNPDRKTYKCFGCGEGGSVFTFLMKHQGLSFPEAVREVAQAAGVSLPKPQATPEEMKRLKERDGLLDVLDQAGQYYQGRLWSSAGARARAYLAQRGLPEEVARRYGLGYAEDGWDGLLSFFRPRRVNPARLEEAGLVLPRKGGTGYYDRFRSRLIFPIRDQQGRIIAFGGRAMEAGVEPKYLNSPETAVFKKGRLLYGLSEALAPARSRRRVVVVEGYIDCLSLAAAGLGEVVATMGTALTGTQVRALRGLNLEVILVFDGDEAGLKAALRAQEVFRQEEVRAKICALPGGLDPDDFVRREGPKRFEALLGQAKPMVGFVVDRILDRPLVSPEDKAAAIQELAPVLGRLDSPVEQAAYVQEVAGRLGVREEAVLASLSRTSFDREGRVAETAARLQAPRRPGPDRRFLAALVNDPACRAGLFGAGVLDVLTSPDCLRVAEEAARLFMDGREFGPAELIDRLDSDEAALVADMAAEVEAEDQEAAREDLLAAVTRLKLRSLLEDLQRRLKAAQAAGDHEEEMRLVAQLDGLRPAPSRKTTTPGREAV